MRISAIAIGFFIGFVIPAAIYYLVLLALGTAYGNNSSIALNWLGILWVLIAIGSPVVAGYVSARLGRSQPLLHGFMVGVLELLQRFPCSLHGPPGSSRRLHSYRGASSALGCGEESEPSKVRSNNAFERTVSHRRCGLGHRSAAQRER